MSVKLLTEHHLGFLSLKGGSTGSSESTLVKMPHCWKSRVTAQFCILLAKSYIKYFNTDEGRADPNTTKSRPSSASQQNAIKMAFQWRTCDVLTLNAGLVALWFPWRSVLLRNLLTMIFQLRPHGSPLWICA